MAAMQLKDSNHVGLMIVYQVNHEILVFVKHASLIMNMKMTLTSQEIIGMNIIIIGI